MDILEFKKDPDTLFDKYAPKNIREIIGCKKQVYALVDWLKKYEANAFANLKAQASKKNGKKTRKRRTKEVAKDSDAGSDEETGTLSDEGGSDDGELNEELAGALEKSKKRDPNTCSCAIITGDHGTGKTAVVRAVLADMGYQIKSVNFAKAGNIKSVDDFVDKLLTSDDVYDNIDSTKRRKYAVLVDEIQSAITPTEKNIITGLSKMNSEIWGCPVIFVGSNKHKKIMTSIKKDCYHISMYQPDAEDMLSLLERVGVGEGMVLQNEEVAIEIINNSQNDYRRLIVILGELHRLHGSNVIKKTDIANNMKFTGEKDVDRSIFENTSRLFSKYEGINSSLKVFGLDKTNMPLMVHQNHFLATNGYIKDKSKLIDVSYDITDNLAKGDVVENFIYSDQNWPLQETYGFYSCVYPSYTLSKTINTEKLAYDSKNPYYRPAFSSQYPKDLNRTSTKCINYKKNIKPADEFFKDMTIDDYVLAVKTIKNLLEDGRVDECEELLKSYGLTSQGIMYVLKMDKINGTRKDVPKSIENKVKHIAVEPIKVVTIRKK
ncbi:replication factor C large subunit [Yasminevirus sp. GU-2018]|uniref:Replication factor C large subunit n=1 Tax=Yasminevirus sp. GU-2018 TaxID=2420051 RepID=A0A5K0U7V6_9VIRU|nr:replication factor C large subunit [Yasminevirus sp. GU-2018]